MSQCVFECEHITVGCKLTPAVGMLIDIVPDGQRKGLNLRCKDCPVIRGKRERKHLQLRTHLFAKFE